VDAQVLRLFHRVRPPDFREQLPVRESFSRADNMAEQRVVCLQDAPHARLLVKVKLNADEHRLTLPTFPRKLTAMPSNFDEAFAAVQSLAKDFDAQKDFYLSPQYQEAEVRKRFIDKFLHALGWDVNSDVQKNPFQQEVKIEPAVTVGKSERHADYAFYVAPHFRKHDVRLFVEAKKPAGELVTPENCYQTIRYGANAGTPLAALTSFRQLVVLDSRYKLNIDTATKKVVRHYDYTDYADAAKFREIFDLLSRDAVAANSLETLAESLASKRGKAVQRGTNEIPIGDAFLKELDTYRGILARAFKNRNPDLDGETLTEITQRTLDRLVFLRFLEDKGIETKESVANFGRRGTPWLDFVAASKRLNGIYNGIVFRPHKLDGPDFQVDEDVFAGVCKWLSDPRSFYLFDIIPIHTLGSIYEQFLGKVIVTTDKRARVEEKPEVRKAGGVYYTPDYIVRYIVENTVGKLIAGKTPAQIAEMRFADIACGSGSFLLGVFDLLLHYHRDWFNANPDKAKKAGCVQRDDGAWHLSLQQRREILLHNIYGVDIDRQAVEVAQLSLYLKLLEEETTGTAREYQMEFHETLLPSLAKNIVCGNSLIGTDIVSGELFEPVEERKLNPMNFEDRFPQIFRRRRGDEAQTLLKDKSETPHVVSYDSGGGELRDAPPGQLDYTMPGVPLHGSFSYKKSKKEKTVPPPALPESEYEGGFDAILGNPPYLPIFELDKHTLDYFAKKSLFYQKRYDAYALFIEQSLRFLKSEKGLLGYIVPSSLMNNEAFILLRKHIAEQTTILEMRVLGGNVFCGVNKDTMTILVQKKVPTPDSDLIKVKYFSAENEGWGKCEKDFSLPSNKLLADGAFAMSASNENDLCQKIAKAHKTKPLSCFCKSFQGIVTGSDNVFIVAEEEECSFSKEEEKYLRPFLFGSDIGRYGFVSAPQKIIYVTRLDSLRGIPKIQKRLEQERDKLSRRRETRQGKIPWYALHWPRDKDIFEQPKILIQGIRNLTLPRRIVATVDNSDTYAGVNLTIVNKFADCQYSLAFFLGILNSGAVNFLFRHRFVDHRIKNCYIDTVPIPELDLSVSADKALHDKLVALVEQMLAAKPQLARAQSDADKEFYGNKCVDLDRRIDALVYELYGLTADEIKIVEGVSK
jgi:type I restriction-modification system DNA methylase subunit